MTDRRRRLTTPMVTAAPAVAVMVLLFGGAFAGVVMTSLRPDPFTGPATFAAWRTLLGDDTFWRAVIFTAWITVASTLISVIGALALASLVRDRPWARRLAALPVLVPHLLVAAVAVLWLGPGGLVDRMVGTLPLDVVRSRSGLGIVLVYALKEIPFLLLLLLAAWDDTVAARQEAAAVHGASPLAQLRTVVIPALRGPLLVGALVVAAFVIGAFDVPLVMGPTAPDMVATYALRATRVADLSGQAVAAAALLTATVASLALAVVAGWRWSRDHA